LSSKTESFITNVAPKKERGEKLCTLSTLALRSAWVIVWACTSPTATHAKTAIIIHLINGLIILLSNSRRKDK
jgi:hypothetical protein